ncbi:MAG: dNTP triphosphohydrolase [Ktedonobacterales bacterium]|nr:dNTP triphosphohydrolase [Ktedonobacterales bacterium]
MPTYSDADSARKFPDAREDNDVRSPFEVDRARIIHSVAFRRLQGKTQIFGMGHDTFFRTRLTHSLEVAQIAKGIAMAVNKHMRGEVVSTELVEAISLAHDIGHPPFGHAGERALDESIQELLHAKKSNYFESNAQNIRLLTQLEAKRRGYLGLNLTRATLDGLLKHKCDHPEHFVYPTERPIIDWVLEGSPARQLSFETEIVDWADQVAYSVHDLEDGIHAGMITSARMSEDTLEEHLLGRLPDIYVRSQMEGTYRWLVGQVRTIEEMSDARQRAAARKDLTSDLIHRFITAAKPRRRKLPDGTPGTGRYALELVISPAEMGRALLYQKLANDLIVHDQRVATLERRSRHVVRRLFRELIHEHAGDLYPDEFRGVFAEAVAAKSEMLRAEVARDYIAGMTDDYAEMLYQRLFSPGTGSLFDAL